MVGSLSSFPSLVPREPGSSGGVDSRTTSRWEAHYGIRSLKFPARQTLRNKGALQLTSTGVRDEAQHGTGRANGKPAADRSAAGRPSVGAAAQSDLGRSHLFYRW